MTKTRVRLLLLKGAGAAGAATVLILDEFTAANGTALSGRAPSPTNTPGFNWANLKGTWDIQNNRAQAATLDDGVARCAVDSGVSDFVARVTFNPSAAAIADSNVIALLVRLTDAGNYWAIGTQAHTFNIFQVGPGFDNRASASVTINAGVDHEIEVTVSGTEISATLNGGNLLTYSSSVHQTSTKVGMWASADTPFDDLTVEQ